MYIDPIQLRYAVIGASFVAGLNRLRNSGLEVGEVTVQMLFAAAVADGELAQAEAERLAEGKATT